MNSYNKEAWCTKSLSLHIRKNQKVHHLTVSSPPLMMTEAGMRPASFTQLMVMGWGPVAEHRIWTTSPGRTTCLAGSRLIRGGTVWRDKTIKIDKKVILLQLHSLIAHNIDYKMSVMCITSKGPSTLNIRPANIISGCFCQHCNSLIDTQWTELRAIKKLWGWQE